MNEAKLIRLNSANFIEMNSVRIVRTTFKGEHCGWTSMLGGKYCIPRNKLKTLLIKFLCFYSIQGIQ
jgi:hypothetical protein